MGRPWEGTVYLSTHHLPAGKGASLPEEEKTPGEGAFL